MMDELSLSQYMVGSKELAQCENSRADKVLPPNVPKREVNPSETLGSREVGLGMEWEMDD